MSSDLERQLAETHAALEQSEAGAAVLRQAIGTYLADVTIDASYLQQVLRDTDAGTKLLTELHELREQQRRTVNALVLTLSGRPDAGFFTGMRMLLQRWFLRRWEQ